MSAQTPVTNKSCVKIIKKGIFAYYGTFTKNNGQHIAFFVTISRMYVPLLLNHLNIMDHIGSLIDVFVSRHPCVNLVQSSI